jgi:hypothetical protein
MTCKYDPQVKAGSHYLTPMATVGPAFVPQNHVKFVSGEDEILLRVPEYNDNWNLGLKRINRRSMNGNLILRRDQGWQKSETLNIAVRGLHESVLRDFQTFVLTHLGKEVEYTDYNGLEWVVLITNPEEVANYNRECDVMLRVAMYGRRKA